MSRLRVIQISRGIVLAFLVIFIISNINLPKNSSVAFNVVQEKTFEGMKMDDFNQMSNQEIKRLLNLNPQDYESISFKRINDPMQADEFVIVKFHSNDQSKDFETQIENRMNSQKQIYDGYAPEEAKLVDKGIINIQGNYALYAVGDTAKDISNAFEKSLKD